MGLGDLARKIDDLLIDGVFQPILDYFLPGKSPWRLGLNFQLGSLVFLAFAILIPILRNGGASWEMSLQNMLGFVAGLVLFLGFSRMNPVAREGMGNPMRPMLLSYRLLVLGFSIYDIFSMMWTYGPMALSKDMVSFSDIVFTIGLYFMACRTAPPRTRKKAASYAWQGNA